MTSRLTRTAGWLKQARFVIAAGCMILCPWRVDASSITITNYNDDAEFFGTTVRGKVGFFPDIHFLVDIPGTPWESSSTIYEAPAPAPLLPDILRVDWTIRHLEGPHAADIDPNGSVTLSLTFIPTAAGPFGASGLPGVCLVPPRAGDVSIGTVLNHPLTTGGAHFDDFCLDISGVVSTNLVGGLSI